jgi:ketosteroid isomerase-like protein
MKSKLCIACFFCIFLFTVCKRTEEQPSPLERAKEIQNQIAKTWEDYIATYESENIDSLMTFYTERFVNMPEYGSTQKGLDETKEMLEKLFEFNRVKITKRISTELMIHREDIFEIGEIEQLFITNDGDSIDEKNRYIVLFQRQEDGRWKFHRWFNQPEK